MENFLKLVSPLGKEQKRNMKFASSQTFFLICNLIRFDVLLKGFFLHHPAFTISNKQIV